MFLLYYSKINVYFQIGKSLECWAYNTTLPDTSATTSESPHQSVFMTPLHTGPTTSLAGLMSQTRGYFTSQWTLLVAAGHKLKSHLWGIFFLLNEFTAPRSPLLGGYAGMTLQKTPPNGRCALCMSIVYSFLEDRLGISWGTSQVL